MDHSFSMPRIAKVVWTRMWCGALAVVFVGSAAACSGMLDVSDPTLVQDSDIANARGANSRRFSVVDRVNESIGLLYREIALFTDERTLDARSPLGRDAAGYLDARDGNGYQLRAGPTFDPHLGRLDEIVTTSSVAIPAVRAYSPDSVRGDYLAQLFALRGYAIVQMAEDICSGFPINDIKDNRPVYSEPYTTDEALTYGLTQLDSALVHGQDSARFLNLARVVRGRTLLDLGRYAEAAAAVAAVPTEFTYVTDPGQRANQIFIVRSRWNERPEAVGEREGGTGLPFVSAQDPRVPSVFVQARFNDPTDSLYDQQKFPALDTPLILATGIEARLIEAEGALAADDPTWLAILNALRTSPVSPGLSTIDTMPSTADARVDLVYSERAFWLHLTGRRLGDMRRLIRNYGRDPETVFPIGPYSLGGLYFAATAIPFNLANQQQFNSHITTGCTTP